MYLPFKNLLILFLTTLFFFSCQNEDDTMKVEPQVTSPSQAELVPNTELLTVINIMQPDAKDQDRTISLLRDGIDNVIKDLEGFVSASIHKSKDNNFVLNYAQWKTGDDLQAAVDLINGGGAPNMAEAFSIANPEFHPYRLKAQFSPQSGTILIDQDNEILTIVNLLQPNEGVSQQELSDLLAQAMEEEILSRPGFISATVHESLDNDYVINYAQWKDQASLDATIEVINAGDAPLLGKAFSIAQPDFHVYSIEASLFGE